MNKKEFKENIIKNIEEIKLPQKLIDYSNEVNYQEKVSIKPFNKVKLVFASLILIAFIVVISAGFNGGFSDAFEPTGSENTESAKPKDLIDSFKDYYYSLNKVETDDLFSEETLEEIYEEFSMGKNVTEVTEALELQDHLVTIELLYEYYLENLK